MRKFAICLLTLVALAARPFFLSAQVTNLINEDDYKVSYSFDLDYLTFTIVTKGSPSIDVDVNQNGIIDNRVDRCYGLTATDVLCAQFLIDENTSTTCGQETEATLSKRGKTHVFQIPYSELSSLGNGRYYVLFSKWNGKYSEHYPGTGIGSAYVIKRETQPTISWIAPSITPLETTSSEYLLLASVKSVATIKNIKVLNGETVVATETDIPMYRDEGRFAKYVALADGPNAITVMLENVNGEIATASTTITYNEPKAPPLLSVSNITFTDSNGNNRIDGGEDCAITFSIINSGKGPARNLRMLVENRSTVTGLTFTGATTLGTVEPGATQSVTIPIAGSKELASGKASIKVSFEEKMGFPPDPFELNIDTKEFARPDIQVVDNSFLTDNGSIKLGLPIQLKVLVQNVGQGIAENVRVSFQIPDRNVFPNGEKDFDLGTMEAGASKELVFEFVANKLYADKSIPVTISTSEKHRLYSQSKQVAAEVDSKSSGSAITIASNATDRVVNIQLASLSSDVDKNIPQSATKHPNRYALIIGNEDYSSRQVGLGSEVNVAFAVNDARVFREYAINTLGVDEKNCFLLTNATAGEMSQKIELVFQILSRLGEAGELIFYYAGHGFPDEVTRIPYLIPVDVSANNLQSAIKLSDIYGKLSQTKAKRITAYLDACFTGGGRDQGLLAARGVKVKPKQDAVSGNMVVFTATSEEQSALPYREKQHGMFTYFLLKKLQETKGDVTYGQLGKYLNESVSLESLRVNGKAQDPTVSVSPSVNATWEGWMVK